MHFCVYRACCGRGSIHTGTGSPPAACEGVHITQQAQVDSAHLGELGRGATRKTNTNVPGPGGRGPCPLLIRNPSPTDQKSLIWKTLKDIPGPGDRGTLSITHQVIHILAPMGRGSIRAHLEGLGTTGHSTSPPPARACKRQAHTCCSQPPLRHTKQVLTNATHL